MPYAIRGLIILLLNPYLERSEAKQKIISSIEMLLSMKDKAALYLERYLT